jgi:hypoxanthine phosphoribosyltransferase
MAKLFITPDALRIDSFALGSKVIADKFYPDFMVSIYRGGTPVSLPMSELFKYGNIPTDSVSIRTSRYIGINKTAPVVQVHNLGYLTERITKTSKILLVDDVFDSGVSIDAVFNALQDKLGDKMPDDIRTATVYYKPTRNVTSRTPNYYIHESDEWIVFPHEIEGLTIEDISQYMDSEIGQIVKDTFPSLTKC